MISSAVVIPDQADQIGAASSLPNLKRKSSLVFQNDRKRPRVNTDALDYDEAPKNAPAGPKSNSASVTSPLRRSSSALSPSDGSAVEEKKRNKRLFGSLLGTLSQAGSKPSSTHKKRDEIEARQRERVKKEHEEQEAERKRQKDDLAHRRREQQQRWQEESTRLCHQNMRSMACFLRTKIEPVLYYQPWELREDEEDQIRQQKADIELEISQELNVEHVVTSEEPYPHTQPQEHVDLQTQRDRSYIEQDEDTAESTATVIVENDTMHESRAESQDAVEIPAIKVVQNSVSAEDEAQGNPTSDQIPVHHNDHETEFETPKDDDHHGEELVEGQEDDVIY